VDTRSLDPEAGYCISSLGLKQWILHPCYSWNIF